MKTKTARTSGLTLELLKEKSKNPRQIKQLARHIDLR